MAKIVNEKYSMEQIVRSSSQDVQIKISKIYLHLKYFLCIGNLVSAVLKLPEFYKMISFAYSMLHAKNNQTEDEKANDKPIAIKMMFDIVFLYFGLFIIIIDQIFLPSKIVKKKYNSFITYFILFGIYFIFLGTACFANLHKSTMPFAFALFMAKISLFSYLNIYIPSFWWHILFKTSIIIDIFLYVLTIFFYLLVTKLKTYTVNRKYLNDQSYSSVENV